MPEIYWQERISLLYFAKLRDWCKKISLAQKQAFIKKYTIFTQSLCLNINLIGLGKNWGFLFLAYFWAWYIFCISLYNIRNFDISNWFCRVFKRTIYIVYGQNNNLFYIASDFFWKLTYSLIYLVLKEYLGLFTMRGITKYIKVSNIES